MKLGKGEKRKGKKLGKSKLEKCHYRSTKLMK